jgi:CRP/FNR family cyclic AMP-dependent transcriptional regulator
VLEPVEASLEQTLSAVVVPFLERSPQLVGSGPAPTSNERPGAGFTETSVAGDAVAVVLALGDDYLRLVATQALGPRFAQRLPTRGPQEEHVLQMVDRLRFLRSVPVFKHLSPEDLLKLAEIATLTEHAAGSYIFRKGDPGDVLCVVMRGRVEIRDQGQLIATQRQNDFFGELAIFDQEPRSADAVCVDDTELLEIGGADLESLMERRPEISREIIRVLAKRLRTTTQELVGKSRGVEASPAAAR